MKKTEQPTRRRCGFPCGGFMLVRNATMADVAAVAEVEKRCFPASEAATEKEFRDRIAAYGDCFWLLFENDRLVSFIDGMATDERGMRCTPMPRCTGRKVAGR